MVRQDGAGGKAEGARAAGCWQAGQGRGRERQLRPRHGEPTRAPQLKTSLAAVACSPLRISGASQLRGRGAAGGRRGRDPRAVWAAAAHPSGKRVQAPARTAARERIHPTASCQGHASLFFPHRGFMFAMVLRPDPVSSTILDRLKSPTYGTWVGAGVMKGW